MYKNPVLTYRHTTSNNIAVHLAQLPKFSTVLYCSTYIWAGAQHFLQDVPPAKTKISFASTQADQGVRCSPEDLILGYLQGAVQSFWSDYADAETDRNCCIPAYFRIRLTKYFLILIFHMVALCRIITSAGPLYLLNSHLSDRRLTRRKCSFTRFNMTFVTWKFCYSLNTGALVLSCGSFKMRYSNSCQHKCSEMYAFK